MFAEDYDPNDVPLDQARGYSYPVPANPLSLPLPVMEEYDYDDYDPNDVPADQAAPTGYLPPTEVSLIVNNLLIKKVDIGVHLPFGSHCIVLHKKKLWTFNISGPINSPNQIIFKIFINLSMDSLQSEASSLPFS